MAKKPTTKPKRGRPRSIIDWEKVGKMFESGATVTGVAASIGVDPDTLAKRSREDLNSDLSAFKQQKLSKGDEMIRNRQFEVALSGDKTMLIWLGKNRLNQSDKSEVAHFADPDTARLVSQIQLRAKEKGIPYEQELKYYLEHYAGDVKPEVKTQLASELEM